MTPAITLHFDTLPTLLRVVRKQTGAAAVAFGATEFDAGRVELAVAEALSNAHDHGYGGTPGRVELEIAYALNWFAVTIRDEGRGFLPGPSRFPEPLDPKTGNGYGLQVIKELMDESEFQSPGSKGGTTLRMAIRLR